MEEWSSYSLRDILMFSARVYDRLIAQYNADLWPAHLLALGPGAWLLYSLLRPGETAGRTAFALLGAAWLWTAHAFVMLRFAPINWPMDYIGPALLLQGLLLIIAAAALRRPSLPARPNRPAIGLLGLALLYPLIAPLTGRPWSEAELIGLMPDPTAIATLALLCASRGAVRWAFMIVPLCWLGISAVTLHTMGSPDFFVPALAGIAGLAIALLRAKEDDAGCAMS
jgi:hypothetical protein